MKEPDDSNLYRPLTPQERRDLWLDVAPSYYEYKEAGYPFGPSPAGFVRWLESRRLGKKKWHAHDIELRP